MSDKLPHMTSEEQETLKNLINEATNSKLRSSAETEHQKEIKKRAKDELGVPTKLFNQAVKITYEHSAYEYVQERDAVLEMAEIAGVYLPDDHH